VLLKNGIYGPPVDLWYLLQPLFPGTSEISQIKVICSILGTPTPDIWPEGKRIATSFPMMPSVPLATLLPNASLPAIQLLQDLLQWNPARRPTAQQALKYPFFDFLLTTNTV
jgi:serine/threonine protein kinase